MYLLYHRMETNEVIISINNQFRMKPFYNNQQKRANIRVGITKRRQRAD